MTTGQHKILRIGQGPSEETRRTSPVGCKSKDTNVGTSVSVSVRRATTAARKMQHDSSMAPGTPVKWNYSSSRIAAPAFELQLAQVITELRNGSLCAPEETWRLAGEVQNRRVPVDLSADGWVTKLANAVSTLDD